MCKVTLSDEDGLFKICLVSNETPYQILKYYNINPDTKIVYLNGEILSKERMRKVILENNSVHLTVRNKTVMR